jgi:proteasome lid subunit RPN8/RPN11
MPKIIQSINDEIIAHARSEAPYECCGLLAGEEKRGVITDIYRINNLPSDDPRIVDLNIPSDRRFRYMMDPQGQFIAMKDMRHRGIVMMGVYHSHPHSPAYPSDTDLRLAFYSDIFYFIVSLENDTPDLRAFSIVDNKITEDRIEITTGSGAKLT